MKRFFFLLSLLISFSIGQVWADEELKATLDFTSQSNWNIPTSGTNTASASFTDGTYTIQLAAATNYKLNSGYLILGKSGSTLTLPAFTWNTTKIVVTGTSGASASVKQNIFVGNNAVSTETTGAQNVTNTYKIASTAQAAGTIYVFKVTSSHNTQIAKIEIYGEAGASTKTLSSVAVTGAPTKTSYYAGDNFDPAGLTVTGTYSDESTATITSGITWSYDPSQELALNQTSIGVIATVSEIASPKFNVTGLTVTEVPAAATYEKVTSTANITDGDYLIVYEDGNVALNGALTTLDAVGNTVAVTINDGVITGSVAIDAATVTINTTAKTIQTASGYYIGVTSYSNGLSSSTSNAYEHQNISIDGGNVLIYFQQQSWNSNKNGKMQLCYNSGSDQRRFRYFKEGSQKAIQLYKKVDGAVKPSAELSYATADQKKLTKLGETFTAPTLVNPHGVAVTYASSAESVATVAANGAVTIKAAGVATITASFAGNDDYKAGDASYTIGVTTHAGTEADPYVAADAKIAIDAMGTVENAYATGVVSNVVTTTLPQDGYITFYFSADGTTTDQVEAYKCYGLNSAPFEAVSDVVTGATVVVTGNLKKFNSTYEFDQNCHLVSYTAPAAPKTPIANDQAHPYTVAQAITYAADGVTYDLDDYVYVQGVVYDVKSFNNGAMNIFIKDADTENQFELYKCAGINDGSATTPFEALTDVQEGDVVIGYGQLTVYNNVYEFKQGNYLVDLDRPAVAVSSVELASTATVKVGNSINLSASVLPANATDKVIEWSIQSGNANITLNNGTVTGVAEGEAVVRATSHADNTKYAECTITIEAADPTYAYYFYGKVTETAGIEDGQYLIVYEDESVAFNGGLETLDAAHNTIAVEIEDGLIVSNATTDAASFTIGVTAGTIQAAMGDYIGVTSYANGLKQNADATTYPAHSFSIDEEENAIVSLNNGWSGTMILNYNTGSNDKRFRYYKDGSQQKIQLYKRFGTDVAPKANPQLAWDPADDIEITVGETFTAPTLTYAQGFNGVDDIVIESDNTNLATVNAGVVSLVTDATGEATITATFAGNDNYKAAEVSYTITVNSSTPTPASGNVVILAEYNSKFYAMTNSLANGALAGVEVEKDGSNIVVASAEDKAAIQWIATVTGENTTFQDGNSKYLAHTGTGTNLMLADEAENWTFDSENGCYSAVSGRAFFYYNTNGVFKNYSISSNLGKAESGYSGAPEVIEIDPENIVITSKADPELAYTPASATITIGGSWSAPELTYANGFDGLAAVTYASNNEAVATVTEAGVISLAGGTGTAVITASFAGNASYRSGAATYTITVNEAGDDLSGTWALVTDAKQLAAGKKVVIAYCDIEGNYIIAKTMGAQNTNNRAAVASSTKTASDYTTIVPASGTKVFTLVDAGDGKFALQASNGKYLTSATSGTGNNLLEAADYELDNAKWTISISDEVASVVAAAGNKTVMQYNSSSTIFSCYGTANQKRIRIYMLQEETPEPETYAVIYELNGGQGTAPTQDAVEEGTVITLADATGITAPENQEFDGWLCDIDNEKYNAGDEYTMTAVATTFTAQWKAVTPDPEPELTYEALRPGLEQGRFYSACVRKNIVGVQGGTLWDITHRNGNLVYFVEIVPSPDEPLAAGRPFILVVTGDFKVAYGNETPASAPIVADNSALRGTFDGMDQAAFDNYGATKIYMLVENQLRQVVGQTGNSLAAYRAFLLYDALAEGQPSPAPGRRVMTMSVEENVATDINFSNGETINASKIIRNGQILILRDGKTFDVTGREMK